MAFLLGFIVSLALLLRACLTSAQVGTWGLEQAELIKTRVWEVGGPRKFISLARAGPGRNDGPKHSQWMDWEKGRETVESGSRAEETLGESKGRVTFVVTRGGAREQEGVARTLGRFPFWNQPSISHP